MRSAVAPSSVTRTNGTIPSAMRFSMMVLMISWTPRRARISAGTSATSAAVPMATPTHSGTATIHGVPAGSTAPTHPPASPPIASCPSAPMLKRPARNPTSNERPVKISGVALKSTWPTP